MQPELHDRFFNMKLHPVIYNQLSAESYTPMLRYAWQNAGYDIDELVDNFTNISDVALSIDIIERAVMTCFHFAFFTVRFVVIHKLWAFYWKFSLALTLNISALHVASTLTPAVTSKARLHKFADKQHSAAHSEVHNDPVTKISYIYVCSNPNTFLVRSKMAVFSFDLSQNVAMKFKLAQQNSAEETLLKHSLKLYDCTSNN